MIFLMTGTPGAGKSLCMAERIYWDVKMGRPVIANFDINRELFKDSSSFHYVENKQLNPVYLRDFAYEYFGDKPIKEGSIKLFIDECSIQFNARRWNDAGRNDWVKFFQLHRKMGYDVYLVSQFDTMIDKQIRSLVEYELKHRKLNNIGWVGKIANMLCFGHPVIIDVMYWYPNKMRLKSEWHIGRKKYFKLYDTYLVFEGDKANEQETPGRALPA